MYLSKTVARTARCKKGKRKIGRRSLHLTLTRTEDGPQRMEVGYYMVPKGGGETSHRGWIGYDDDNRHRSTHTHILVAQAPGLPYFSSSPYTWSWVVCVSNEKSGSHDCGPKQTETERQSVRFGKGRVGSMNDEGSRSHSSGRRKETSKQCLHPSCSPPSI